MSATLQSALDGTLLRRPSAPSAEEERLFAEQAVVEAEAAARVAFVVFYQRGKVPTGRVAGLMVRSFHVPSVAGL